MANDMMNPKQRSAAKDYSSVNSADFFGGVAPAAALVAQPNVGTTGMGPSEVVQGIYVAPEGGRNK
jgi:hypothetical protein